MLDFKAKPYSLEMSSYNDFEFESIYGKTEGILLRLDVYTVISISNKEYKNSIELINLIKNKSRKTKELKMKILTNELKIFLVLGISLLIIWIFLV